MPTFQRARFHEPRSVRVFYKNPRVITRGGKFRPGTLIFEAARVRLVLHTIYGAASLLHRSAVRVQQLIEKGQLKAHRLGRDWLILDSDLREFIASQRPKLRKQYSAFLN